MSGGVGIIVRVPLFEGLLAGTIRSGHRFDEGDWRARFLTPQRLAEASERLDKLEALLDDQCPTLAALALRFCLSRPAVSTVIVGMRNRLIHGYGAVDRDVLWDVVHDDLPDLAAKLQRGLHGLDS